MTPDRDGDLAGEFEAFLGRLVTHDGMPIDRATRANLEMTFMTGALIALGNAIDPGVATDAMSLMDEAMARIEALNEERDEDEGEGWRS